MNEKYSNGELFIFRKMIDGDIHSFKYFFDKYYTDLCNFVHIYLNDKVLSEEIVQDIFVYFWENKEKLEINTSVKSYLYAASKFKGLNLLRNTKNHKRIIEKIDKHNRENIYEEDELYLDVAEFKKLIETAVEQLAPKCREIFLLSKHQELSNREIADKLGISVKTFENQMTIALKKLREHLLPFRGKIFELFLVFFISINSFQI